MYDQRKVNAVGLEYTGADGSVATVVDQSQVVGEQKQKRKIVLLRFEDGVEKWFDFSYIKKGEFKHPKNLKNKPSVFVGDVFPTNFDGVVEVIEYNGNKDILVRFEDGSQTKCQIWALRTGQVAKPGRAAKGVDAWKAKVIALHGNKFDISKTDYKNSNSKVDVVCNSCGETICVTADILSSNEKYKCACVKKYLLFNSFVEEAGEIHQYKYQYVRKTYSTREKNVEVVCPYHGSFIVRADAHVRGSGCPACVVAEKEEVFKQHLPTDYTFLCCVDNYNSAWVKHKACGEIFRVNYNNLKTRSVWCNSCWQKSIPQRVTFDVFLERARKQWGYEYSYSDYVSVGDYFNVTHSVCGNTFKTKPTTHLQGNYGKGVGCPHCASYGFNPSREAYLYLLHSENTDVVKVGITHQEVIGRIRQIHKRSGGNRFKEYASWKMVGAEAITLEKEIHSLLKESYNQPENVFDGSTECFINVNPFVVKGMIESLL